MGLNSLFLSCLPFSLDTIIVENIFQIVPVCFLKKSIIRFWLDVNKLIKTPNKFTTFFSNNVMQIKLYFMGEKIQLKVHILCKSINLWSHETSLIS